MIKSPGITPSEGNEISEIEHVPRIICLFIQPRVYVLPVIGLPLQQSSGMDLIREMQAFINRKGQKFLPVSSLTCMRARLQLSQAPEAL